jgi:opacity protein-like surface antigen
MKKFFLLSVLLALLLNQAQAQGNLVVNGGFDAGTSGWTLTNGAFGDFKAGNPVPCLQFGNTPSSNPSASQTINGLSIDTEYVVSGDYENFSGNNFGVAMNGIFLFQDSSSGNENWQKFSFFYTATSTSVDLSLSAIMNGGIIIRLDNIAMYPVPEPSTETLLGLGGILLLGFGSWKAKVA